MVYPNPTNSQRICFFSVLGSLLDLHFLLAVWAAHSFLINTHYYTLLLVHKSGSPAKVAIYGVFYTSGDSLDFFFIPSNRGQDWRIASNCRNNVSLVPWLCFYDRGQRGCW